MEPKKLIDLDTLEEVSGGTAGENRFRFRMDVYRNDTYSDYVPCLGYDSTPAISLRQCIKLQNDVSLQSVHIYLPSGIELDYYQTFGQNGICDGMVLKAVIAESKPV
ncbi:MAG: hypothetical protein IKD66_08125 [Solobacterium sp.]|nr:hypothetical protein [Solobacterium sp.]